MKISILLPYKENFSVKYAGAVSLFVKDTSLNSKYKNSTELCEAILEETGVAMLPASEFGFNPKRMLTRLSYIDFNGKEFLNASINGKILNDKIIEKYAPNVVEGIKKLSNWVKNL